MEERPERPLGVAILSVLDIIFGILALLGGIVLAALGPYWMTMIPPNSFPFGGFMAGIISLMGIILVVLGLIMIVIGYLLWNASNLARILHIVFAVIGIILGILSFNPSSIIGIIIDLIIIWYLTRPHVVSFFTYSE